MTFHGSVPKTCFPFAAVIVGGIDMMSQSLVLAKKPHIVIGESKNQTVNARSPAVTCIFYFRTNFKRQMF